MAQLTLAYLQEQITKLEAEQKKLAAQQEWMERIFQVHGISGPWVSPQNAADLLCIDRRGVMQHVRRAERFRELGRDCECQYGVHYRQVPRLKDEPCERATWQIHVTEFEKLLAIPQDNLKAG
ncbi:hypothetical protein NDA01_23890 [Trichocoleus desertorum AS-A10]|uniref:hypothetical protein n=1 Tax=Trichocoleus desertorum TaxID=1481672 RepID=UPI003299DAC9